jgi:hypothetical protein
VATREPIYAALASLVFGNAGVQQYFVTTGRRIRHHAQMPAGGISCPAMYLIETGEEHVRKGKGIPVIRTLRCQFVMYFYNGDLDAVVSTACNAGLDAIDDAINTTPVPQNAQTLGGLVEHVYTEGAVVLDEGLLQEYSIVAVPVTILIP